jgi:hypothetical protein
LALSNIYTIYTVNDFVAQQQKRLAKTSISDSIVCTIFKDDLIKELLILVFINNYNHNIKGVNIANQL